MANRFSKYAPEAEKAVRKAEVVENEALRRLKDAWKNNMLSGTFKDGYKDAVSAVEKLSYSAGDVESFSIALAEFQAEDGFEFKAGYFLSALINEGRDMDYTIHTAHLAEQPRFVGYRNRKSITVHGDVGDSLGYKMEAGSITLQGDAGQRCGSNMSGGSIIVEGSLGRWCGDFMQGGTITARGNAGDCVGFEMQGGEIRVEGRTRHIAADTVRGGRIYHRGKLIVEK
jgi:formylmethanofuran dehydrogenase subunit C